MFKSSLLRLLMTLSGLQRESPSLEETPTSRWHVPSEATDEYLKDSLHFIRQAEWYPPTFEDGSTAEQQMKRKVAPRKKAAFDDDEGDDVADFLDDGQLFPAGGPTARKPINEVKKPKKSRRRRRNSGSEGEVDDEVLEERARKRRDREREKLAKIKSALYVKEGDDEFDSDEDEEFFARERAIKARAEAAAKSASANHDDIRTVIGAQESQKTAKRKSEFLRDDSDSDDILSSQPGIAGSSQEAGNASETDNTPMDGMDEETRKRRKLSDDEDEQEEREKLISSDAEEPAPSALARRPRVRGGFVIDSDEE